MNKTKTELGFIHLHLILLVVIILVAAGLSWWRISSNNNTNERIDDKPSSFNTEEGTLDEIAKQNQSEESELKDQTGEPDSTAQQEQPNTQPQQTATTPPPDPVIPVEKPPVANTLNCLPADANQYQKTYIGKKNSEFMQSNGYSNATKFKAALDFAGLGATVDSAKVVVFAPNDYVFDNKLSEAQKTFMNASAENMKSVVGWHVITSCVIWDGNMENVTGTMTLQTLNGAITFTKSGIGKLNNASVAIWDWFTSNGAVHLISDFIAPPTI